VRRHFPPLEAVIRQTALVTPDLQDKTQPTVSNVLPESSKRYAVKKIARIVQQDIFRLSWAQCRKVCVKDVQSTLVPPRQPEVTTRPIVSATLVQRRRKTAGYALYVLLVITKRPQVRGTVKVAQQVIFQASTVLVAIARVKCVHIIPRQHPPVPNTVTVHATWGFPARTATSVMRVRLENLNTFLEHPCAHSVMRVNSRVKLMLQHRMSARRVYRILIHLPVVRGKRSVCVIGVTH
jgi:hypothetical protein